MTTPLHLAGHALPAGLAALAWAAPGSAAGLLSLAGLAAIAGGVLWKFSLIVRAGYTQGFKLSQMPRRGSGSRAAPTRMDASGIPKPADN